MSEPNKTEKKQEAEKQPLVIKKIKKKAHGHHGGAWKIAYADFVTAMMAFFLLMWLLASLNKSQREGIADYFKQPIKIAVFGGNSLGNKPDNIKSGGPTAKEKTNQGIADKQILEASKKEQKKLEELQSQINITMEKDPGLAGLKNQLRMDLTSEGLRIQLIDNQDKPMFDVGSDKLNDDMKPVLAHLAKLLSSVENKITIQGHTDATPYDNPQELDYTNWELSSQRANAARREMLKAGLSENKVLMISGFSSTSLFDKTNPLNPENRRISIIVMKKEAEDKLKSH